MPAHRWRPGRSHFLPLTWHVPQHLWQHQVGRWFRSAAARERGWSAGLGEAGSGFLAGAFFAGAFFAGAFSAGAFFAGAFFTGAFLAGALAAVLFWPAGPWPEASKRHRVRRRVGPAGLPCGRSFTASSLQLRGAPKSVESHHARTPRGVWATGGGHALRRIAHNAVPATSARATTTNGQAGMPPSAPVAAGAGPGVPVPATVRRNDQDPDTTWPSADVTR